jgi:hypothetical protein
MTQRAIFGAILAATGWLGLATLAEAQIKSESGHAWLVRRHDADPNPNTNGDIAFRLEVTDHTVSSAGVHKLKAMLTRYNSTTGSGASKKYAQRGGDGGKVELKGKLTKNQATDDGSRKQIHFELTGLYFDETGAPHAIRAIGYYHSGKKKNAVSMGSITNRDDDRLCLRIHDKPLGFFAPAPAFGGEPCDEEPPDEDVLTDEPTTPDPPDYDP